MWNRANIRPPVSRHETRGSREIDGKRIRMLEAHAKVMAAMKSIDLTS